MEAATSWRIAWLSIVALMLVVNTAGAQNDNGQPLFTVSGATTVLTADTISVQGQVMQLYGIDGPLPIQPCILDGREWDCGVVAARQLEIIVADGPVTCTQFKDPYFARRAFTWGKCEINGTDISAEMVRTGWAVAVGDQTEDYVALEQAAHDARIGLWKADNFERPSDWEFRMRTQ